MFKAIAARRAATQARRAHDLAIIEGFMAANEARLAELREYERCPYCDAMEAPRQREVCAQAGR